MVLMYDPPGGWKYGFPKPFKPELDETVEETLRRDGYPEDHLDQGLGKYTCFQEVNDE